MSVYGQRVLWRQCATQSVSGAAAAAAAASAVCGGGAWLACLGWRAVGRSRRWLVKDVGAAERRKRPSSTLQSQNTATHTKVHVVVKKEPCNIYLFARRREKAHAVREEKAASKRAAWRRTRGQACGRGPPQPITNYTKDLVKYCMWCFWWRDEAALEQRGRDFGRHRAKEAVHTAGGHLEETR
eukprot:scaffold142567_cov142-Phaeocystis_antarctica.AAC.1